MERCAYGGSCSPYQIPHRCPTHRQISFQQVRLPPLTPPARGKGPEKRRAGAGKCTSSTTTRAASDATALRRPAAVMRDRSNVFDRLDVETTRGKSADGRLAAGAGTLDLHIDRADAMLGCDLSGVLRGVM